MRAEPGIPAEAFLTRNPSNIGPMPTVYSRFVFLSRELTGTACEGYAQRYIIPCVGIQWNPSLSEMLLSLMLIRT